MMRRVLLLAVLMTLLPAGNLAWCAGPSVEGPGKPPPPPGQNYPTSQNSLTIIRPPRDEVYLRSFSSRHPDLKRVKPKANYEHTLDGVWDDVIAHIGFTFKADDGIDYFVSVIGLGTYPEGNGVYSTDEWDKKVFWIDVGDNVPMHLAAEFVGEFYTDDTETDTIFVYQNLNVLYRQKGKDYSGSELNGEWIYMEIVTDPDNNYLDHEIVFFDENDEEIGTTKLQVGDQIQTWTASFDFNTPDIIWLQTMEEQFRTVTKEPSIYYSHLTPNIDFPNGYTDGKIDFSNVDLEISLLGIKDDAKTGETEYFFSAKKELGFKWNNEVSSGVPDWQFLYSK
ncbi:MAG: hypothetical protein GC154_01750 [bacterium]|nr:hypothetical protein [bacterium]